MRLHTRWQFTHRTASGRLWASEWMHNILHDEGEQNILDSYLRAQNTPTAFYLRLANDTLADADTLSSVVNEVSGTGYAAVQLARNTTDWPTLAVTGNGYRATSKTVTFTNSGGTAWTAATVAYVGTSTDNSGRLVISAPLSTSRTLQPSDSLDVSIALGLDE